MNKLDIPSREEVARPGAPSPRQPRRAPKAAIFLLPVWGYAYVRNFLEHGLPTLLAPGNVTAVANSLPTEFIILTSAEDEDFIREHASFKKLAAVCNADIRLIDHLITDGNYSTTITLAYTEAVRAAGDAMLDTCFFFLVSDYIVADGSLANVLSRMQKGMSAVVAGNFQVVREDALPWLQNQLLLGTHGLALQPRELMRWALNHVHPATLANTVNIPLIHNSHTNRLFWRVDSETMLGRFYLMHMICVRPEVTDFIIGASCDYSFIPEMCPSGNVEAIADSDEYLVIEMQPGQHESGFLRPGPLQAGVLAKSLSEWTTRTHRENARNTVIFHAGQLPAQLAGAVGEADRFVDGVARRLRRQPIPYRGHPYWRGAMAAFHDATGRKLDEEEWRYALGLPATKDWITNWLLWRAKYIAMGRPPRAFPWHPAWPDFKAVLRELAPFYSDPSKRLLMLSNEPTVFTVSLADSGERVHRMRCVPFLQGRAERYKPLHGRFDLCLLELPESDMSYAGDLVERIIPLMKTGGQIIVSVLNRRSIDRAGEFGQSMAYHSVRMLRSGVLPTEFNFASANVVRRAARRGMSILRGLMNKGPWISTAPVIVGGGLFLTLSFIGNVGGLPLTRRVSPRGHKSSFLMRLTVDAPPIAAGLGEQPTDRMREKRRRSDPAKADHRPSRDAADQMRESQYNRCLELKEAVGLTSLGLMTNQVWYDDPRRLTFLLSRYKFVAKMLSGCVDVGEIGCGDAFGTRIVLQEIPNVTVYDFDPIFIKDIQARLDARWPFKAEVHDIVAAPLPRKHDAIYSLDVIEHIAPTDEDLYLANICASLRENGLLMIGTPSLESQAYASPQSKIGHINCKSGPELKALLKKYFSHVFIFSMNDEVVHTGFSRMAHYLFALCAMPRRDIH